MKRKHIKRRRLNWPRVLLALLLVYLIAGITWAAIDSHRRPEHHERCIREGICSVRD